MKKLIIFLCLVLLTLGKTYAQYNVGTDTTAIGLGATSTDPDYKFPYSGYSIAHYGLGWYMDPSFSGGPMAYFGGYGGMKFFTEGSPRLMITGGGNVGVGTVSPGAELDVEGGTMRVGDGAGSYSGFSFNTSTGLTQENNNKVTLSGALQINTTSGVNTYITGNGNVLIGQTTQVNSAYKLDVAGNARVNEVVVNTTGADFVFEPSYKLNPLSTLGKYINKNHRLPEMPSAKQMQTDGLSLGENQTKLLQKVEELTLYLIEKDKQAEEMEQRQQTRFKIQKEINQKLQKKLDALQKQIKKQ